MNTFNSRYDYLKHKIDKNVLDENNQCCSRNTESRHTICCNKDTYKNKHTVSNVNNNTQYKTHLDSISRSCCPKKDTQQIQYSSYVKIDKINHIHSINRPKEYKTLKNISSKDELLRNLKFNRTR